MSQLPHNTLNFASLATCAHMQVARAYLKTLPSDLPLDPEKAVKYFQLAVNSSQEPDAYFGLAQVRVIVHKLID